MPPGCQNGSLTYSALGRLRECSRYLYRAQKRSPSAQVRAATTWVQRRKWTLVVSLCRLRRYAYSTPVAMTMKPGIAELYAAIPGTCAAATSIQKVG